MERVIMKYKTYIDSFRGYESLGIHDLEDTIFILDHLILYKNVDKKIKVVEIKEIEFPIFIYLGDIEEYQEFRNSKLKEVENEKKEKRQYNKTLF